jgi:uncharacterized protein with PQ loop repeat
VLYTALDTFYRKWESREATVSFYRNIGTVAVLGSSISFAFILTSILDPKEGSRHGIFDLSAVRILLAVGWALSTLVLYLSFSLPKMISKIKSQRCQKGASKALYILDIAAMACLSLAVAAYVEVVGYIGVALAVIVAVMVVFGWLREKGSGRHM